MKYVWHDGGWVEAALRSATAAPFVISDTMQPLQHPVSGAVVDSKSAFRAMTRAAGCVELGNDAPAAPMSPGNAGSLRQDIHRSWQKLEQGYRPMQPPTVVQGDVRVYGR